MKTDGGYAFPSGIATDSMSGINLSGQFHNAGGMSLRDWFAGQALSLGGEFFNRIDDQSDPPNPSEHCARIAYAIADAMIKERERQD